MMHPQLRRTYVLAGPIRWVEPDGRSAVLRVDAAGGPARRFCGRSVTLDLDTSRIGSLAGGDEADDGLKAGQMVTVKARLPRRLEDLPSVLAPRSVHTLGPLV
jgi:hypothetical protein